MMRTSRRILTAALLCAGLLWAAGDAVFVTPTAKRYHSRRDCLSLARSTKVTSVSLPAAAARGLLPCGICARRKGGK